MRAKARGQAEKVRQTGTTGKERENMTTMTIKSDAVLRQDVEEELTFEPKVKAAHIGVSAENGVVVLSGHVGTYSERWEAERAVLRVQGVRGLANELQVELAPLHLRDDHSVTRAVVDALEANLMVPEGVQVKVYNGLVTLMGEVEWQFQRQAAEAAVRHLVGVQGVMNTISLKPQAQIDQKALHKEISRAFHRHASLDAERIQVETEGKKVILRGKVRSWAEHEDAEKAAWAIQGVEQVDNKLELSYET